MRRHHAIPFSLALAGALAGLASVSVRPSLATGPSIVVQPGDTLTSIAASHGTSVERLAQLNALSDPNRILAGQTLRLDAAAGAARTSAAAQPADGTHIVASGETLTGVAARYGTTVEALVATNALPNASLIVVGQRLELPSAAVSPNEPRAGWKAYVVRPGDNLTGIAAAHGTTVAKLAEANQLANPSMIVAGRSLHVPAPSRPAAAPSSPASAAAPVSPSASAPAGTPTPAPAVEASATTPMPDWMHSLTRQRDDVRRLIVAACDEFGVPTSFALSVAWQESGWQQSVVSSAGAIGVMQLLPDTADWVGDVMLGEAVDIHSPTSNVRAGVRLLRHYLDRYDGDRGLALAAYFQGERAVDEFGIYAESAPYIDSILYHERFFGG